MNRTDVHGIEKIRGPRGLPVRTPVSGVTISFPGRH